MNRAAVSIMSRTAIALLGMLALVISGCGAGSANTNADGTEATPEAGGTLRVSQGEEVITLDPFEGFDMPSINVNSQIIEPLFKINSQNKLEPWLVTKVDTSANEKVWTLKLRDDVHFSTGKLMTSDDVLFTLEEGRKSIYTKELLVGIDKVEAPTPSTIVITTKKATPELEAVLSQWSFGIVPKNWGGGTQKDFAQHPIGTGPFMLGSWKHGESITLEKNPHYWMKGRPYLDKVVFQTVNNAESRAGQLEGGQLDLIYSPPYPQLAAIESAPELEVGKYPFGWTHFLILNNRNPLFKNPKVREAVRLAVDREGLVKAALFGDGKVAGAWVPPAVPYYNKTIEPAERDVEQAEVLLSEAEKEGVDPAFSILTPGGPYWGTATQIVQQNLEEVGFNVEIKTVADIASVDDILASGRFDMETFEVYDATPSPGELFAFFNQTKGLYAGTDVTEMTALTEQVLRETNESRRRALWYKMQQIIEDEHFLLPLTNSRYVWAFNTKVTGFSVSGAGIPWLGDTGFVE